MTGFLGFVAWAFAWLMDATVQASLIACLILLLTLASPKRVPARWRYLLWLVLVARMVMPWAPESAWSLFNLLPETAVSVPVAAPPAASVGPVAEAAAPMPAFPAEGDSGAPGTAVPVIPLVWFGGALVVGLLMAWNSLRLWREVAGRPLLTDGAVLTLLESCKQALGVGAPVVVVETAAVSTPALFGFIRPRLLLPEGLRGAVSAEELRYVFLHELAHVKRYDIACNWLLSVLQAVHWFNPLIWFAFARLRADRELACDAMVLDHAGPGASRGYGETILRLLERYTAPRRALGLASLVGVMETKSQMKRRITMIAGFKRTPMWTSVLAAGLVLAVSTVVLTDAVQARSDGLPDYVPETSYLDESGRIVDKTDWPFVNDPRVIGVWRSVDFVSEIDDFEPGAKQWQSDLFLKELVFLEGGYTPRAFATWTKGLYFHSGDHTAAAYHIADMRGSTYMFFEWKSGDYIVRHAKPKYYVLEKQAGGTQGRKADKPVDTSFRQQLPRLVPRLDINSARLDDVIAVFGEPVKYAWGQNEFTRANLPDQFCVCYPDQFMVVMNRGFVKEVRFHNPGYSLNNGLTVGSPYKTAMYCMGQPVETVNGGKNEFKDGVLYINTDGRAGSGYYQRSDQGVRVFFKDSKVNALYLTRTEPLPGR